MIAFGIAFIFLGWVVTTGWGAPSLRIHNKADYAAGAMILLGLGLVTAGAVVAAWKYLP